MFIIPRPNVIENLGFFSVEVLGRTGLIYKEGEKEVHIDSEFLTGPSGIVIYASSIDMWSKPNRTPLRSLDRERIIKNIIAAFKFRGFDIEII